MYSTQPGLVRVCRVICAPLPESEVLLCVSHGGQRQETIVAHQQRDDGAAAAAGVLSRLSRSVSESAIYRHSKHAASNTAFVTNKLKRSTGKAAWIAGTTFLILVVPLIIEMDREQQLNELELQQATLLGAPAVSVQQ